VDKGSEGGPPGTQSVARHTEEYRPGRLVEVLRPAGAQAAPVVLLWHGSGPDERDALVPLAVAIATYGPVVLVPDWRSDDRHVGASELLASIDFTTRTAADLGGDPGRVVLAGWSLGASAAADIALHPGIADGWHPTSVVGLGGGYDRTPFASQGADRDPMAGDVVGGAGRPALLVHGTSDNLIPLERSVCGTEVLAEAGWRVVLRQVATDHAGVIGTEYDREMKRCVPSDDSDRLAALASVAREVARMALGREAGPE
jgi:predicted esterase